MRALGVEIEIPPEWLDCEALIIRTGDEHTMLVFDTRGGSAAYAIWVQLVARAPITLLGCQIRSYLDDQIVLASLTDNGQFYKHGAMEFPKRQVLNSRLENGLSLRRGQMIEGVILASGLRPIPTAYRHGSHLPCTLGFLDQYGNEISRESPLFVDRTWQPKNVIPQRDTGLYGRSSQFEKITFRHDRERRDSVLSKDKNNAGVRIQERALVEVLKNIVLTQ